MTFSMSKLLTPAPSADDPNDPEPNVPDKSIIVVQFGVPHLLYHQGTGLDYWVGMEGEDETAKEMYESSYDMNSPAGPYGVYAWFGRINGDEYTTDCGTEYDSWIEGSCRPLLKEEWAAFVAGDFVWDPEQCKLRQQWENRWTDRYEALASTKELRRRDEWVIQRELEMNEDEKVSQQHGNG